MSQIIPDISVKNLFVRNNLSLDGDLKVGGLETLEVKTQNITGDIQYENLNIVVADETLSASPPSGDAQDFFQINTILGPFDSSDMNPNDDVPTTQITFTKTIELPTNVSSAFLLIDDTNLDASQAENLYTRIGGVNNLTFGTGYLCYISENFTEATRLSESGNGQFEYKEDGTTRVNGISGKTYSEIGNFFFGTRGYFGELQTSMLFGIGGGGNESEFVTRSIYLDNSTSTTKLTFDFEKVTANASSSLSTSTKIFLFKLT